MFCCSSWVLLVYFTTCTHEFHMYLGGRLWDESNLPLQLGASAACLFSWSIAPLAGLFSSSIWSLQMRISQPTSKHLPLAFTSLDLTVSDLLLVLWSLSHSLKGLLQPSSNNPLCRFQLDPTEIQSYPTDRRGWRKARVPITSNHCKTLAGNYLPLCSYVSKMVLTFWPLCTLLCYFILVKYFIHIYRHIMKSTSHKLSFIIIQTTWCYKKQTLSARSIIIIK